MLLKVQRVIHDNESTLGKLYVDGKFICHTLEDEPRTEKVKGETRIPAGKYRVTLRTEGGFHQRYVARFGAAFHKGMLWVRDVPGFEWILIHLGNTEQDTDGCILVGMTVRPNGRGGGEIAGSEIAYRALYPVVRDALLRKEPVDIEVVDEDVA
jgi:hypothetical protein